VADLFRVRIPTARAHALNCYLWLGPDGVTVVDTGWADSAPVIARALELLGRRTSDVERIVLSHFHDYQVGSAAAVAQWPPRPSWPGEPARRSSVAPSRGHGLRSPRPNRH
jgi:glyoxylase-like metal-dependent hydrolase (beta-lactamase superfamily II)